MFVPYIPTVWVVTEAIGLLLLYALGIGVSVVLVALFIGFNFDVDRLIRKFRNIKPERGE